MNDFFPGLSVDIRFYITGKHVGGLSPVDSLEEKIGSCGSYPNILAVPGVSVRRGRPDLKTLLGKEIQEASGPISVNGACVVKRVMTHLFTCQLFQVCGGRSLAKATREAVRAPRLMDILRGGHTVSLFADGSF